MATSNVNFSSVTDSTDITITLASLATSSTLVAGRSSTEIVNTTTKYDDFLVTGQVTTGTTPTTLKTIAVYLWVPLKIATSTFTYPVAGGTALTGADEAATWDAEQRNQLFLAQAVTVNATSDRKYPFAFSVREVLGFSPLKFGLFIAHDTVAALNATAGNHWFSYIGIKEDIA